MTETDAAATPEEPGESRERSMPTSQPVLLSALRWGLIATVLLVAAFGLIGWLVSGTEGLIGGMLGAGFSGVFLAMTLGSITFANRFTGSDFYVVAFFSIVMGTWLLKFAAFFVAALLLKDAPWLDPTILFLGVVAGVIVSLVIDVLIVARARIPIVPNVR